MYTELSDSLKLTGLDLESPLLGSYRSLCKCGMGQLRITVLINDIEYGQNH